jgi:hypothetical protein
MHVPVAVGNVQHRPLLLPPRCDLSHNQPTLNRPYWPIFVDLKPHGPSWHDLDPVVNCTTPATLQSYGCKLVLILRTKHTPPPPTKLEVSNDTIVHSEASTQHRRISLPTMAPFDTNQWFQITLDRFGQRPMVGQPLQAPNTTGWDFFKPTDNAFDGRLWQLYPVDDTRYILRSQLAGPDTYLAI